MRAMIIAGLGVLSLGFATMALSPVAQAEEPTSLGKFEAWEAFTYEAPDSKVCYVFAAPFKSDSAKKVRRSAVYFMVTHWPGRKVKGQISTIIGYPFKEASDVKLSVDDKAFNLYPVDDLAWADKSDTDKAIVTAMKAGKSMIVTGISARGTETTDSYSLSGLKAALGKIDSVCK